MSAGKTLLHFASSKQVVDSLLANGADIDVKASVSLHYHHMTFNFDYRQCMQYVRQILLMKLLCMLCCATNGIVLLISVFFILKEENTILHSAGFFGHCNVFLYLIKKGCSLEANNSVSLLFSPDFEGRSILLTV